MHTTEASASTRIKVGVFTLLSLLLIGLATVLVNDKPFWWRACDLVHINVEDATGLKAKSAVRSLGLEIGYLRSVVLSETHVELGICITEKVEIIPATRAYIRSEGFLGDKFVELKPVKYVGPVPSEMNEGTKEMERARQPSSVEAPGRTPVTAPKKLDEKRIVPAVPVQETEQTPEVSVNWLENWLERGWSRLVPSARAEEPAPAASPAPAAKPQARPAPKTDGKRTREIPVGSESQDVQQLVKRVDSLVDEMTSLTSHLKEAINPEDLRSTMKQLNRTLENASKTLSPESGLNQTAQRTLAKLEDAIEQLRDLATRINQGEGSLGMLLNDPTYAEEIKKAIKSANQLLNKVSEVRFNVDIGGEKINGFDTGRGWFRLGIWPKVDRYYLLGISTDPRGLRTVRTTTSEAGGVTTTTKTTQIEETGILVTAMVGKVFFNRLDLSLGALNGDGAVSAGLFLWKKGQEDRIQLRGDVYSRATETDGRVSLMARIFMGAYLKAGIESFRKVNGITPWSYGAGVTFDDEDIKLLFALR